MRDDYDREDLEGLRERRARADHAGDAGRRIAPLGDLDDYQVADGYPDVRGWAVVDGNGRKLGSVHELIVDTAEMRTRYLDIALDKKAIGVDDDRDVLVPVGTARLDDDHDHVLLDAATVERLAAIPAFTHGPVTRDYEDSLLPAFGATGAGAGGAYYAGEHFDDSRLYANRRRRAPGSEEAHLTRSEEELEVGRRAVNAGEVDVKKSVETEHVAQPITTRRKERLDVEDNTSGSATVRRRDEEERRSP
jgi:hypothetical protein